MRVLRKGADVRVSQAAYYNPTWTAGLGLVYLWPLPTSTTLQGVIYTPVPVAEFASLSTTISLPPGYRRFLRPDWPKNWRVRLTRP